MAGVRRAAARRTQLSAAEARRVALAAQGFARPRRGDPGTRTLTAAVERLGALQLDSVNVLARAHYLPLFSRLGPYDRAALDRLSHAPPRRLFEYWGHEASLLPVATQPLLRWRMSRARDEAWGRIRDVAERRPELLERIVAEVAERGPLPAGAVTDAAPRRPGPWWDWSDVKWAFAFLFWSGRLTCARRRGFERLYDLPERVLPPAVLAAPTPAAADAQRELLRIAARALGVATARDLRHYFRLPAAEAAEGVRELVEAGDLEPIAVEGWRQPAFLHPGAAVPRRVDACALVGPFDSLVWDRARVERIFDFRYRIEIYVPAARRVHGYYVLPFLLGDRLVARVDLKADRQAGVLRVLACHQELDAPAATGVELAAELERLAAWLGLAAVAGSPAVGRPAASVSGRRSG